MMGTLLGDRESLNLGSRGPGLGDRGPELIRERSASREGDGDLGAAINNWDTAAPARQVTQLVIGQAQRQEKCG